MYLETTAQKAQRPAPSSQPDVAKPYGITRSVEPIIVFHTVKMIESEPAAPGRAEPSSSARCSPASTSAIGGSRSSASAGLSGESAVVPQLVVEQRAERARRVVDAWSALMPIELTVEHMESRELSRATRRRPGGMLSGSAEASVWMEMRSASAVEREASLWCSIGV